MKPKKLVSMLAFAAVFLAELLPPEAYPDGKLAVILCATFAFIASVIERRIHPAYIKGGVAAFAFLVFHSAFISVDAYRSLSSCLSLWAYYCLFGYTSFTRILSPKTACDFHGRPVCDRFGLRPLSITSGVLISSTTTSPMLDPTRL